MSTKNEIREFTNPGCGRCLLLKQHAWGTVLAAIVDNNQYVVASGLNAAGEWYWGEYFKTIDEALKYYNKRTA